MTLRSIVYRPLTLFALAAATALPVLASGGGDAAQPVVVPLDAETVTPPPARLGLPQDILARMRETLVAMVESGEIAPVALEEIPGMDAAPDAATPADQHKP